MDDEQQGSVSVIIPARNEEANIARVVRSVAGQQSIREIIVVDDQSQDGTGGILDSLKTEIPSLTTIRIETLPEGWLGKTYAAATGARCASGEWLLFTDADTEHLPDCLVELLRRAEEAKADLLSLSPGQLTTTWWEKSLIPWVFAELARLYPFEKVGDIRSPAAAANGQYLLVRRQTYERIGGHEAVRGEVLEDLELARRVKLTGGRLVFLPGAAWVRTRMYHTFSEMWKGWTKNLYLLYGGRLRAMLKACLRALVLDTLPVALFLGLCLVLAAARGSQVATGAAVACFLIALIRQWVYGRALSQLGFERSLASYQALGAVMFILVLCNSVRAHRLSGRIQWKGRVYVTKVSL